MAFRFRILLIVVCFILIFGAVFTFQYLPVPKNDVLQQKNHDFSGVLRVWVYESRQTGTGKISTWLTAESARFEKKHDGVYVQVTPVSAETLSSFDHLASLPPDAVVFCPGENVQAKHFLVTDASGLLRKELIGYAGGVCTPIAAGCSVWAVKDDLRQPLNGKALLIQEGTAASALCAMLEDVSFQKDVPDQRFGIDLGLTVDRMITCEASGGIHPGEGSMIVSDARKQFARGTGNAVFLTQAELFRLSQTDSAPEFSVLSTGKMYTDRLALLAVTDLEKSDPQKQKMCVLFLEHLLSDGAQTRLSGINAFRVTDGASLYAGKRALFEAETMFMQSDVIFAPAFSASLEEKASELFSKGDGAHVFFNTYIK